MNSTIYNDAKMALSQKINFNNFTNVNAGDFIDTEMGVFYIHRVPNNYERVG